MSPTAQPPEELIAAGESASREFKSTLADSRKLVETIAAMATIGGGVILVGVRDDGAVIGVEPGEGELERLVQRVLAGTDPRVFIDVDQPSCGGARLLRIRVPPGDGPHLAFGRAFYRSGPATVAMSRDEYERRLLDRLRESSGFERRIEPGLSADALDPAEVGRFREQARDRARFPLETGESGELMQSLHLGSADQIRIGALLLFGRDPQRVVPQAVIRARAIRGAAEDAASIEGTLPRQIEAAVEFVLRNIKRRPRRDGVVREEIPELPPDAVREVVANAVVHRDYRSTAPIQLRLDDEGLEVWNPGHLPSPLTLASLRERHPSIPPNPFIARALYLAGYIEEWGTGTLRVIAAMRRAGNPEVLFEVTGDSGIRVVLPLQGAQTPGLSPRMLGVMEGFEPSELFRSADYAERAGVSVRTALGDLAELEAVGVVERVGAGRATRWRQVPRGSFDS
jgi:ATP-dependent DNA helicase RecG